LKRSRTFLDASYGGVAGNWGFFGNPDGRVEGFGIAGPDCGRGEVWEAGRLLEEVEVWWVLE